MYFALMRYINSLSDDDRSALETAYRHSNKPNFRDRCQTILLSAEGRSVPDIARLLKVRTRTIYRWFERFESAGIEGLKQVSGQGVKAKLDNLNESQVEELRRLIKDNPQQLRVVCSHASESLGYIVTLNMIKRFIKKNSIIPGDDFANA